MSEMTFSMKTLEVDGTLRNPYALAAFGIWLIIAAIASLAFAIWFRRSLRRWPGFVGFLIVIAMVFAVTRVAHVIIGTALYRWHDPEIISVGFWGGPPNWVAPCVAFAIFVVVTRQSARVT